MDDGKRFSPEGTTSKWHDGYPLLEDDKWTKAVGQERPTLKQVRDGRLRLVALRERLHFAKDVGEKARINTKIRALEDALGDFSEGIKSDAGSSDSDRGALAFYKKNPFK